MRKLNADAVIAKRGRVRGFSNACTLDLLAFASEEEMGAQAFISVDEHRASITDEETGDVNKYTLANGPQYASINKRIAGKGRALVRSSVVVDGEAGYLFTIVAK